MKQTVGQGGFAMVDMSNNAKIANMVGHKRRKYT
jgi:hypothetical protein